LKRQDGLIFVWVLFVIAITTTLAFLFFQKAGNSSSIIAARFSTMQAHYLARSAANHALWRLLNDPSFPASETDYYMHSLGDGRYGYNVRKPTLTKFGTVATVAAVGNAVTKQSYVQYIKPYDIFTTYEPYGGLVIPKFRQLLGASWVDPSDTLSVGGDDAQFMVLKACPVRKELIMGTLDFALDINFAVWDGTTWGNLLEFTDDTGSAQYPCLEIAYENQSGDALVIGRATSGGMVGYNVWNGSAWAFANNDTPSELTSGGINLSYLDMASRPNSDEILIGLVFLTNDLKVVQWDGNAFNDLGELDNDLATDAYGCVEVVYEQQSGDGMVLWNHKNSGEIYFSVLSGGSLSPVALLPFDFEKPPTVIRAAADPNSNHIFVAALDSFCDLNVALWDGEAWIDSMELDIDTRYGQGQIIDVAWEHSGEEVVVAWSDWGPNNILYYTWQVGTALSDHAVKTGPDFLSFIETVRLHPVVGTQKILLLVINGNDELRYCLWSGNAFLGNPPVLLEADNGRGDLPFDIAESGVTYTGGSG
jgi:hypothetical protein